MEYWDRLTNIFATGLLLLLVVCCGIAWYTSPMPRSSFFSGPTPARLTCSASPKLTPVSANATRTSDGRWPVNQPKVNTVLAATDTHLFVGQARQLTILSLRNVLRPPPVATLTLSTTISSVAVQGSYAYVVTGEAGAGLLRVIDIADPARPQQLGALLIAGRVRDLAVSGTMVYVMSAEQIISGQRAASEPLQAIIHLAIVDLSAARRPRIVGQWETLDAATGGVAVAGGYAYLGGGAALYALDVRDATRPVAVGACGMEFGSSITEMLTLGDTILVGMRGSSGTSYTGYGFYLVDSINAHLTARPASFGGRDIQSLAFLSPYLYTANGGYLASYATGAYASPSLMQIDVSKAQQNDQKELLSHKSISLGQSVRALTVSHNVAYIADNDGNVRTVDFLDPEHPRINWLPIPLTTNEYSSILYEQSSYIGITYPNGYGATLLTGDYYHNAMRPALSPDRTKVAFAFNTPGDENRWNLYTLVNTGTETIQLTNWLARSTAPRWSPDGTRIVFQSTHTNAGSLDWDIWVINADGSDPRRLTSDPAIAVQPRWSPDDTRIAFTSYRDGNGEIYVMNADGSEQHRITNDPANDEEPAWSPDGTQIAWQSSRAAAGGAGMDVWVMRADGSAPRNLTRQRRAYSGAPSWSPDGTRIAFHGYVDTTRTLFTMRADGSGEQTIFGLDGAGFPDWR